MQPDSDLVEVEYREDGHKFYCYTRKDDPERKPVFWRRKDYPDVVYRTEEAKFRALATEILRRHVVGQPLLVGTTSVELSERLSGRLKAEMLQRLATVLILRDAYLEAHDIPDDGMRVEALDPLYQPLDKLSSSTLRPFARELGVSLNPTKPDNLARLVRILDLEPEDTPRLEEALQAGIRHSVLNAKKHDEESRIIAGAGALGAVTIATNMAGRGVDIKLGGELAEEVLAAVNRVLRRVGYKDPENMNMEERLDALASADRSAIGIYDGEINFFREFMQQEKRVREVGGLHVIGSERHESRRIDNQLRGRAARQGDPGSSQFYISLEDELMRLFGGMQVSSLMQRLNIDDAVPIAHNIVNKTIEQAQTRVEGANFDTRKHLLEYDDVLNQQREVYYGQRDRILTKEDLTEDLEAMLRVEVESHVQSGLEDPEGLWRLLAWLEEVQPTLGLDSDQPYPSFMLRLLLGQLADIEEPQALRQALLEIAEQALEAQYAHLVRAVEEQLDRAVERLDDQVRQRVEMAELAVEGALLEADETGVEPDPRQLLAAVERAVGLRLEMDQAGLDQIVSDARGFQRALPEFIEASLGLRIWAGLLQAVERRVGESLGLETTLPIPLDWDEAADRLLQGLEETWQRRTERLLTEVDRDLELMLGRAGEIDEALKLRLLVQMSYGQRTFFDRKTHQRRSVMVARFTYAFFAAQLMEAGDPEDLTEAVLDHLRGAWAALRRMVGETELARLGNVSLADLDEIYQRGLRDLLGEEAFEELAASGPLSALPESLRQVVVERLGQILLTETYRNLTLSVGDRVWVDYLTQMEALRTSIGLEAYAQRDPLVQYKSRAFDMFQQLLADIRAGVVSRLFRVQVSRAAGPGTATGQRAPRRAAPEGEAQPARSGDGAGKRKRRRRRRR